MPNSSTNAVHRDEGSRDHGRHVTWNYSGPTDPFVGSGATLAERWLAYGMAAALTAVIVGADALHEDPIAQGWLVLVLALFAFDVAGGAGANMLNSCKRFYHAPLRAHDGGFARWAKNPRLFTAIHIHPIIVAFLFGGSVWNAVIWYAALQAAVAVTLSTPLYLRRGLATGLTVFAILLEQTVLPLGTDLEWFIPCLFIKMVMGHAVQEEPYGPARR